MTMKTKATELRAKADAACAALNEMQARRPTAKVWRPRATDGVTHAQQLAIARENIAGFEFEAAERPLRLAAIEAIKAARAAEPDPLASLRTAVESHRAEEADLVERLRVCRDEAVKAEADLAAGETRLADERTRRGEPGIYDLPRPAETIAELLSAARNQEIELRAFLQRMHEATSDAERNSIVNVSNRVQRGPYIPTDNDRELAEKHRARAGA